ncbi:SPOR domain-containing protein [Deferrisoma palaeochoriense]
MRDRRHVDDRHVVRLDTGRLVVAAVGGSLVLVLVFLLGVFVGRSLWAPPALPPELAVPQAGPKAAAPAPEEQTEVREPAPAPEPELTFYRELKKPVPPPEAPSAGAERNRAAAPKPPRPAAKASPVPPEDRAPGARPPAPKPVEAPPPVFTVQVGSFRARADAERFLAEIRKKGVEAAIVEASVAGRTWYRVQAGRFLSRTAAAEFQESVLRTKGIQGFVTTR